MVNWILKRIMPMKFRLTPLIKGFLPWQVTVWSWWKFWT
uniref:Macaca fascicularis brain cDNA clone: QflA-22468, similar to human protocadherin alpha 12 (PCDHA12), transcript variant 2, mRNA, RefSeq: NM_031864.1 n=1 Tax=Macaca fascicularis TaxID=9541 RepID=I7GNU9_MACFA|nr:unnamed protein product [Macaca fascicularis]